MTYTSEGYEVIKAVMTHDACDALIEAAAFAHRIVMPHKDVQHFKAAMSMLAPIAREKLKGDVSGLGSDYFSTSAGFGTHTDNDHVQALPRTFLSIWLALADVTLENGPLIIAGKPILCAKGDALLIDGDTPHRSCAGRGPRPVALFTYIRKGSPFRAGDQQQRTEVPL